MGEPERWVARVRPLPPLSLDSLLRMPLGLDVWEREDDGVIVAAGEPQLSGLERRHLARVERISPLRDWQAGAQAQAGRPAGDDGDARRG